MPHTRLVIREFKPEDGEAVYGLILSILTTEFKDLPPEHYLTDVKDIPANYAGERNGFFVAVLDGELVGTVAVKEEDEKTALMRRLFVHPHLRGKKVGRKLVEHVYAFCKSKGYSKLIFTGNHRMQHAKAALLKLSFKEEQDLLLSGVELFRLAHKL